MNAVTLYGKPPLKFTLIYDGPLPAGPKKRPEYAAKIRNYLHPQLQDLWENHVLLRQLAHEARVNKHHFADLATTSRPPTLSEYRDPPPPLRNDQIDLTTPISVDGHQFKPIVRRTLYLACAIDILFLRHEEPGRLFEQCGDLDNRLKCFFDGLKIPNREQLEAGEDPHGDPLCCLLEDDVLISDYSVRSGRLLGKTEKDKMDVRIQADITIKVLRVFSANQGLIGG
jgi:hypothetical protein